MLCNTLQEPIAKIVDRIVDAAVAPHTDTHNGQAGLILGPGGVGKSSAVYLAADILSQKTGRRWGVVDIRVLLYDPVELKGLQGLPPEGEDFTKLFRPDWARGLDPDGCYLLLFDELTKALPAVQNALYQGILDRAFADFSFGRNWVPVATGNLAEDKAGDMPIPSPLRDRFWITIASPELRGWLEWAAEEGIRPEITTFLQQNPDALMTWDRDEDPLVFATARSWHTLHKISVNAIDPARAMMDWAVPYLGQELGLKFASHVEVVTVLPDPDVIWDDPENAPLLNSAGQAFYLSAMLAYWVDADKFPALITYAKRNQHEVAMAMINDAVTRRPELMESAAYIAFIAEQDPRQR